MHLSVHAFPGIQTHDLGVAILGCFYFFCNPPLEMQISQQLKTFRLSQTLFGISYCPKLINKHYYKVSVDLFHLQYSLSAVCHFLWLLCNIKMIRAHLRVDATCREISSPLLKPRQKTFKSVLTVLCRKRRGFCRGLLGAGWLGGQGLATAAARLITEDCWLAIAGAGGGLWSAVLVWLFLLYVWRREQSVCVWESLKTHWFKYYLGVYRQSNLPAKHLEQRFMVLLDLESENKEGILLNTSIERTDLILWNSHHNTK